MLVVAFPLLREEVRGWNPPKKKNTSTSNWRPPRLKETGVAKPQPRLPFTKLCLYLPMFMRIASHKHPKLSLHFYITTATKHAGLNSSHQPRTGGIKKAACLCITLMWPSSAGLRTELPPFPFFFLAASTQTPPGQQVYLVTRQLHVGNIQHVQMSNTSALQVKWWEPCLFL